MVDDDSRSHDEGAVAVLMSEHRLIEQVLGSLVAFAKSSTPAQDDARERIGHYATFFREYADRHHHAKEEDQLFAAMTSCGFPAEGGPVAAMLHEHVLGRQHVGALAELAAGSGPLSEAEHRALQGHASDYGELLRAHIGKEDGILFPLAQRILPGHALSALDRGFDTFQRTADLDGAVSRLVELGEELVRAYPPPEGFTERGGGGPACVH